jgi:hypothetical protein
VQIGRRRITVPFPVDGVIVIPALEEPPVMVTGVREIIQVTPPAVLDKPRSVSFGLMPLDVIRELLERELPEIGAKSDMILRGPEFEGITKIEDGRMTLAIETECRQADAHKVKLYLNSELQKLFAKNGIRI